MGIVRPVMAVYPYAWIFFIPFILLSTFTMLNLFIGIIVNTMQTLHEAKHAREQERIAQVVHEDTASVAEEVRALRQELARLRSALDGGAGGTVAPGGPRSASDTV